MTNSHHENVQYDVFSRHRLHYGRLFFQVIAFSVMILLLGTLVALHLPREMRPILAFCGGAMLLVTAFIPGDVLKAVLAGLITSGLARSRPSSVLSRG